MISDLRFASVYCRLIDYVLKHGAWQESRNGWMLEVIGFSSALQFPASVGIDIPDWRNFNYQFAESMAKAIWNGDGNGDNLRAVSDRARTFLEVPPGYEKSISATYGPKFVQSLDFISHCINSEPATRRCITHLNWPSDCSIPTTDDIAHLEFPCTLAWQYLPRGNKLHMHIHMRSQCLFTIFPLDVWVQVYILETLSEKFSLQTGTLSHSFGSLHLYERDVYKLKDIPRFANLAKGRLLDANDCRGTTASRPAN